MQRFSQLFTELDRTTRTSEKIAALEAYFRAAPPGDAAWALWWLTGHRLKRALTTTQLRHWVAEEAGLPVWMVEECYETVGDLGETLALLIPEERLGNKPPRLAGSLVADGSAHDGADDAVDGPGLTLERLAEDYLKPLVQAPEAQQRDLLRQVWKQLTRGQCFLWHKLIMGSFRVGVAEGLIIRSLALVAAVEPAVMSHRLMGKWQPTALDFDRLISGQGAQDDPALPYPFYLASPLEKELADLGGVAEWQLEWKWDGIRAQLIRRQGQVVLWSRGEEVITQAFPEIAQAAMHLPDGLVLDGEILAWDHAAAQPKPFWQLQRRLNRKTAGPSLLQAVPCVFMVYDLLEVQGQDIRPVALKERRLQLEALLAQMEVPARSAGAEAFPEPLSVSAPSRRKARRAAPAPAPGDFVQDEMWSLLEQAASSKKSPRVAEAAQAADRVDAARSLPTCPIRLSETLQAASWAEVAERQTEARQLGTEGLMLKAVQSAYGVGRQRGHWWKWKVSPLVCDVVLVAAQPGHGRRATLFTDYTFAVRHGDELVTIAKAYSGLSDAEINQVDAFVRKNTIGKFGPVRSVRPELIFELAFEGINASTRHKAGLALRFPRIARWRTDKPLEEIDTLQDLKDRFLLSAPTPDDPTEEEAMAAEVGTDLNQKSSQG